MINLSAYPTVARLLPIPFYMLGAILIGLAAPYEPTLLIAAVAGIVLAILAFVYPHRMSMAVLLISAISFQIVFEFKMFGMDAQSLSKLGILLFVIPAMLRFGIDRGRLGPVAALFGLLAITYLFSDLHPLLGALDPIKAFIGLAAPFSLLIIRWSKQVAESQLRLIVFLPLISLAAGGLLQAGGLHMVYVSEFNGAFRLQGANIPAHLAFLAFVAFVVSMVQWKRKPDQALLYYVMMALNFVVLILTGTRGALLAIVPIILLFLFDLSKQFAKGRTAYMIPLFGFIGVLATAVLLQLDNLMKRTFERQTEAGIDLSGRMEAWEFFLSGVKDAPWFGRGLGSVLVANDGSIYSGFVVPHNEYIRFYFDAGFVGAVLLFFSLLAVFVHIHKRINRSMKPYFVMILIGFALYSFSDNTLSTLQFIVPFCVFLSAIVLVADQSRSSQVGGNEGQSEQNRAIQY